MFQENRAYCRSILLKHPLKWEYCEYYWHAVRVFPSYIMTGGNILIEKSKCEMIADDIRRMMRLLTEVLQNGDNL